IPKSLCRHILKTLHSAHPGTTRMKTLARHHVYWPNIDQDIEVLVRNCLSCASASKNPIKTELSSWPQATKPWSRIHIDFAGPVDGHTYLVVIDAYSKWPEVLEMPNISATSTVNRLTELFARYGNPQTIVSDNGTQLTLARFPELCSSRGINHIRSPSFHPQSNGQAERFVDTLKRSLKKLRGEGIVATALHIFLQAYRSWPNPNTPNEQSPAKVFLGRKLRNSLDLLHMEQEDVLSRNTEMENRFNQHHGA